MQGCGFNRFLKSGTDQIDSSDVSLIAAFVSRAGDRPDRVDQAVWTPVFPIVG